MPEMQKRSDWESTVEFFQDSNENVTSSKDLQVNGCLNLATKRAKPNNAGPILGNVGGSETQSAGKKERKPTGQEARKQKAAVTARQKVQTEEESSSPEKAGRASTFSPRKELKDKSKEITRNSSAEKILETFQSRDLVPEDWNLLADQVLTRRVQKEAETILKNTVVSDDEQSNAPQVFQMNQMRLKYRLDVAADRQRTKAQFDSGILSSTPLI